MLDDLVRAGRIDRAATVSELRREFVKYVLSANGQKDVVKDGYLPLPAGTARKALASVGLGADT